MTITFPIRSSHDSMLDGFQNHFSLSILRETSRIHGRDTYMTTCSYHRRHLIARTKPIILDKCFINLVSSDLRFESLEQEAAILTTRGCFDAEFTQRPSNTVSRKGQGVDSSVPETCADGLLKTGISEGQSLFLRHLQVAVCLSCIQS